jgi:predicted acylesterase/phospholipase RssA
VRASLSIPGVFAPVIEDGEMLVDGGTMDNFPVALMAQLGGSDRIIGVQASPHHYKKRHYDYETAISGWRILLRRINPFAKPLRAPSLISTLLRAQEINSAYHSKSIEAAVDLLIKMDVRGYGFLDFDAYKPIAQAGYESSVDLLREWREERLGVV